MRYLLDTHTLVWLLSSQSGKLPESLRESLLYYEDDFFVSEVSLIEIIQLQQIGRFQLSRPKTARRVIEENGIAILPASDDILEHFYDLPVPTIKNRRHSDPFDRIIIATAICRGCVLVSADEKFPWYREHCKLSLLSF